MMKSILTALLLALSFGAFAQQYTWPNVYGGENFYDGGRMLGYSSRNVAGGRDFHWNNYSQQGFRGYQGYGNPHLQDGYAIGAGLANIINAFRGGDR